MKSISYKNLIIPTLSLFTSLGTLVCCALPSLFVVLGAGAVLAGLVSSIPLLIILSKYKIFIFLISGFLLLLSSFFIWSYRNAPCPADKKKAQACIRLRKATLIILYLSIFLYFIGFFFAFIAKYFL